MKSVHKPVMLHEAIEYLNLKSGNNIIDCTYGGGGHSKEILKITQSNGKILAIDANQDVKVDNPNIIFVNDNFKNLKSIVKEKFNYPIHGILLDLGLSSDELEQSGRGFSFQKDEPLDMRFDVQQKLTVANIINSYSLEDLYDVFKNLGEYSHARRLSQSILEQRKLKKFTTTQELVDLILEVNPRRWRDRLHPATKVFQALRIAVNKELENLELVLPQATEMLVPGGRLVVISFHALEDRIVKHYFRSLSRQENSEIKLLTKKPIIPTQDETKENPRSRSAKMRVVEKK
ncbi:16S rRNA (cytosine(1402)-N(4))-methyltransferase RsmH [Patescibacteria group bacterium]